MMNIWPNRLQRLTDRVRANLTTLDSGPVGAGTLVVLLFLDLFVLSSIFDGLHEHTKQLTQPEEYVPGICRDVLMNDAWSTQNRVDRLASQVTQRTRRAPEIDRLHPQCLALNEKLAAVANDNLVQQDLRALLAEQRALDDANIRLRDVNEAYQTELLEEMAKRPSANNSSGIESEARSRTELIDEAVASRRLLTQRLLSYPAVDALFAYVDSRTEAQREQLRTDYAAFTSWYPAKRLGMELLFLAPLALVFWVWNHFSLARGRSFQTLVSTHLLVVAFIPIIFKSLELVYDLIPRKLLADLVALLETFHIIAIWYYLMIAGAIGLAMAVIYYAHKKLFSHERLVARRIRKGECQQCGHGLPSGVSACPDCGYRQFAACTECGDLTFVGSAHCTHCGARRSSVD